MYHPLHLRTKERNWTAAYRREQKSRRIVSESTFVSLDRLGWIRSRMRGSWRMDCEGFRVALAHNVLKAVRRLRQGIGPPAPLKTKAAADAVPALSNSCGEPTSIGEPSRSRSTGFLMMSVVALLWHPVPPSKATFSTSPMLWPRRNREPSAIRCSPLGLTLQDMDRETRCRAARRARPAACRPRRRPLGQRRGNGSDPDMESREPRSSTVVALTHSRLRPPRTTGDLNREIQDLSGLDRILYVQRRP